MLKRNIVLLGTRLWRTLSKKVYGRQTEASRGCVLLIAATATFVPSRANRSAMSLPMPLAAPVMSADLPLSFMLRPL